MSRRLCFYPSSIDSGGMVDQPSQAVALDPPAPPSDLIQSALFLPLATITKDHYGRKVRTIGQYV